MNILMAVRTEVFPIASIRWVVVMISVPVMDRQQVPVRGIELATATAADQSVQGQRLLPVFFAPGGPRRLDLPDNLFGRADGPGLARDRPDLYPPSPVSVGYTGHIISF